MGFKDLFFADDGDTSDKKKKKEKTTSEMESVSPTVQESARQPEFQSTTIVQPQAITAGINQESENSEVFAVPNSEIINSIWQTVLGKDLPGPDYLELKTTAKGLESFIPDDCQRLIAAFNVLKQTAPQLTKQIILDSIETYKGIVEGEKSLGLDELKDFRKEKIGDKEDKLKNLKVEASSYQKQIEELQKKLQQSSTNINKLSTEIMSEKSEFDTKEKTFLLSVESVLKTLNSDKERINQSIQ